LKRGDFVTVRSGDRSVRAMVLLASDNGRSLMLGFEGTLAIGSGFYLGMVPVLQDDDGTYRDLIDGQAFTIERDH
jgi:hypothetical protein